MRSGSRIVAALIVVCFIAACSETDRIAATPTPRVTTSVAVAPTIAAPTPTATATTARPSSTPTSTTSAAGTTPSPITSARPSQSGAPTLPPGASLPPMPAQPALPAGVTVVATGTMTFAIAVGETRKFEPADIAIASGATPPPSATLVWTIAWRATEPLVAAWYRQTSRTELGRGRWGTADLGGAGFELRNDGTTSVFGELSYAIASR